MALAIQKDPSIVSKCKKVVIMGGTVFAPGNITPVAEANFWEILKQQLSYLSPNFHLSS